MKNLNPFDLFIGQIITAYNRGIHKVTDMWEIDDSITIEYQQVFTIDYAPINMSTKYECDIKDCRPAVMLIPGMKQKMKDMIELIYILEKQIKNG